jgi:hypothetical protein
VEYQCKKDTDLSSGGGAGGFSGEVKAGFSQSTQEAISKAASAKTRTMNISYNVCDSAVPILVDGYL